jgi:rubrerythrin
LVVALVAYKRSEQCNPIAREGEEIKVLSSEELEWDGEELNVQSLPTVPRESEQQPLSFAKHSPALQLLKDQPPVEQLLVQSIELVQHSSAQLEDQSFEHPSIEKHTQQTYPSAPNPFELQQTPAQLKSYVCRKCGFECVTEIGFSRHFESAKCLTLQKQFLQFISL